MPGLNGLAVQQALEQRGNQMPIIFLTGRADVPMCAQAMKSGAFDFLTKPVDAAVLFAAVAHGAAARCRAAERTGPSAKPPSRAWPR